MKYKVVRGIDREIRFLPNCIDYEEAYASFAVIAHDVEEDIVHELIIKRQETPIDKIFGLDKNLNIVYYNRYTKEEQVEIHKERLKSLYTSELNIASKFFQEYNFGLNGTEKEFKDVKEYLQSLKNGESALSPEILNQYR